MTTAKAKLKTEFLSWGEGNMRTNVDTARQQQKLSIYWRKPRLQACWKGLMCQPAWVLDERQATNCAAIEFPPFQNRMLPNKARLIRYRTAINRPFHAHFGSHRVLLPETWRVFSNQTPCVPLRHPVCLFCRHFKGTTGRYNYINCLLFLLGGGALWGIIDAFLELERVASFKNSCFMTNICASHTNRIDKARTQVLH